MANFPRNDGDVLHAATLLRTCLKRQYVPHVWRRILDFAHYEPCLQATASFEPRSWTKTEQRRLTLKIPSGLDRNTIDRIEARIRLDDVVLYFGSGMLASSFQAAACLYVTPPGRDAPHLLRKDLLQVDPPFMRMFAYEDVCPRADYIADYMEVVGSDPDERDTELDEAPTTSDTVALPNGLKQQLNLNHKKLASLAPGWQLTLAVPPKEGLEKISGCSLRISLKSRVNLERMEIANGNG